MATQFALCPEDRERYGGPEWVTYDKEALDDLSMEDLFAIEAQCREVHGVTLAFLLSAELLGGSLRGKQMMVWLCRQVAARTDPALKELAEPPLSEFVVKPRRIQMRAKPGGDVDPPAQVSSTTSPVEELFESSSAS